MPNRPGNDDRIMATGTGGDRSAQRDVTNDPARQNASQGSQSGNGQQRTRSNRGFASMDREKQKEIASKGGRAAHAKGTAHEFDSGEAREAGRKGGQAVSRNREHMAAIGRRGGEARGHARARANTGAQVNSGNSSRNLEGSFQNSRANPAATDRQVAIDSQSDGVNSSTQGNRGGNNSLGGERRTTNTNDNLNSGESFGNR
ncbi:MAG TPA: KGG domain-containing protein [Gemmatimonadaceae bacterium]|nr:KGG domain-containing protein [Gemmatimonadaceae bacterium]